MQDILASAAIYGGISLLTAGLAVVLTARLTPPAGADPARIGAAVLADAPRRYEFRQGYLVSTLDPGDAFLPEATDRSIAFDVLARGIGALHPDLPARLRALLLRGEPFVLTGALELDALSIAGRAAGDRVIVTIGPAVPGTGRQMIEDAVLDALRHEAEDLRRILDLGRAAMWKETAQGQVVWANAAYLALVGPGTDASGDLSTWPVPRLFHDQLDPPPEPGSLRRCHLMRPAGPPPHGQDADGLWFDVAAYPQPAATLFCAAPIDRLVGAETALRDFVQTLSKTFAHLPIGLAVFDKRRELMIFNPALVELSTLSPAFLSRRPGLVAFLDALRDARRMPEPRNYRSWRDDIARLEQGAQDDTYQELWTLPTGESLRVIGRPHPDGAVAFLFQDITAEVSLTRKFRGDLDVYRAALDDTPEALAVFSAEGRLILANRAYAALWGIDPKSVVGVHSVGDATQDWQARCAPSPVWRDIRAYALHQMDRSAWEGEIVLTGVGPVAFRVAPLAGGAMAVRFRAVEDQGRTGAVHGGGDRAARPAQVMQGLAEPAAPPPWHAAGND